VISSRHLIATAPAFVPEGISRMKSDTFDRQPAIRTIAMPADTNPSGDIFGGWLMGLMDLAAASTAVRRARCRVATVAA
jgi:acyl-CoA thioesterase YciA